MEYKMPSGLVVQESFDTTSELERRRAKVESEDAVVTRVWYQSTGKYKPHQGQREIERRRRQREKIEAKAGMPA